jgi:hypothetical protein
VAQGAVAEIIGHRGEHIAALSAIVRCQVVLARARAWQFQLCTVTGSAPNVLLAELAINHIDKYGYHPFAHRNFMGRNCTHVDVPLYKGDPEIRFVIGVHGCEKRHIQNSYRVRVLIPQSHSAADSKVVLLGENPNHLAGANNYIRKLLPRARKAEEAEIAKGEEAEEVRFWEAIDKQLMPMKVSSRGNKNASAQRTLSFDQTRAKAAPRNPERHGIEECEKERRRKMQQRDLAKNRNCCRNIKFAS